MLHNTTHKHHPQAYADFYEHNPLWATNGLLESLQLPNTYDQNEIDDFLVQFISPERVAKAVKEDQRSVLRTFTDLKNMVSDGTKRDKITIENMVANQEEEKAQETEKVKPSQEAQQKEEEEEEEVKREDVDEKPLEQHFSEHLLASLKAVAQAFDAGLLDQR
jgi:hypothetical protein